MENKFLEQKIRKLKFVVTEEAMRYELSAIFTIIILTKSILKKNIDVQIFLGGFDIEMKKYLQKSRTNMLGKTLKLIATSDTRQLEEIKNKMIESLSDKNDDKPAQYIKSILNKYSRNEKNEE